MAYTIPILETLIDEFRKMPSVGTKSAERMAFYVLGLSEEEARRFAGAIIGAHEKIHQCAVCRNLPEESDREVVNLLEIKDHYPKYVVTLDELAAGNINGVKIVHLADFLLSGAY